MCVCCVCVHVCMNVYCYILVLYLSSFQLRVLLKLMFYYKICQMFYVNDKPKGKFLYTETTELYLIMT